MSTSLRSTDSDRKLADGPVFDQGFSAREARRRAFIAFGPGWAGFKLTPNSEEDGDEAAQERGGANEAHSEQAAGFPDAALLDTHRPREVALETIKALGVEFATAPAPYTDEHDRDGEAEILALVVAELAATGVEYREDDEDGEGYPDDEDDHPRAPTVFRNGQFMAASQMWNPMGAPGRAWRRRMEDNGREFDKNFIAALRRHSERLAKAVEGIVVRHADYGIFVRRGHEVGLVHVDAVRGHGSRAKALAFLHGKTVGTRVRVIPGAYREAKRRWDLELA
ncbi:hypothetical protein A3H75_01855 [Candidatus Uhrbacteria bacterium RIFCSPLOWO2_02_FULL_51_9]|uniref:Uncharacterized protein n=1 Tax=Candidatus Uhrbacteria bacterium RIFCSPLOWO2_02_FULL_51_9 TaxID=1802410 RepID=A0A1F7VD82_9BACT|nr:MAG: hypothetical protein A3H75_01855 [Candidatus Uhrbacteria bacterium RIFCSPLOWO2_02_FULL_51_9]